MNTPSKWPPYLVAFLTFLGMIVSFGVVMQLVVAVAVARGLIPETPPPEQYKETLDLVLGSPAKSLAISVVINSFVVCGIALVASSRGLLRGRIAPGLIVRLRLGPPRAQDLVVAVLGLVGLTTALDAAVGLLGLRDYGSLAGIREAIAPLPLGSKILFAGLIGLGPGVTEEVFFRGYMLNRVGAAQGITEGLVVSSVVFGLFHADPVHTVLSAAMGFYLGVCLIYSRSLWVPIAAHVVNNVMATMTVAWAPNTVQAVLLIPLGTAAGCAAIVLLSRGKGPLFRQPVVW